MITKTINFADETLAAVLEPVARLTYLIVRRLNLAT